MKKRIREFDFEVNGETYLYKGGDVYTSENVQESKARADFLWSKFAHRTPLAVAENYLVAWAKKKPGTSQRFLDYLNEIEREDEKVAIIQHYLPKVEAFVNTRPVPFKDGDIYDEFKELLIALKKMSMYSDTIISKDSVIRYSIKEIALIYYYLEERITERNALELAQRFNKELTTTKLLQERIDSPYKVIQDEETPLRTVKKYNRLMKIKEYFKDEVEILRRIDVDLNTLKDNILQIDYSLEGKLLTGKTR